MALAHALSNFHVGRHHFGVRPRPGHALVLLVLHLELLLEAIVLLVGVGLLAAGLRSGAEVRSKTQYSLS